MEKFSIRLTDAQVRRLEMEIDNGEYPNINEAVRDKIRTARLFEEYVGRSSGEGRGPRTTETLDSEMNESESSE